MAIQDFPERTPLQEGIKQHISIIWRFLPKLHANEKKNWSKRAHILSVPSFRTRHWNNLIEFFLNLFAEFRDKSICHYSKRAQTHCPAASCVRAQHATTVPARHMWETGSLKSSPVHASVIIRFTEFLFHLGKTSVFTKCSWKLYTCIYCIMMQCTSTVLMDSKHKVHNLFSECEYVILFYV